MKIKPEIYSVTIEDTAAWSIDSPQKLVEAQAKFKKVEFLKLDNIEFKEGESYYRLMGNETHVLSKDQIIELSLADIKFKIVQTIDVQIDITQQLVELAEKPIRITQESGASNTYNNRCDVHLPGNMLAMYNEMAILEDACTDVLQSNLNAGWRIVAACPQPDQRRPDYVLGRFNPNHEADASASRGE